MQERIDFVIELLEEIQDHIDVLEREEVYDCIDEVIKILMISEANA